MAKTNPVPSTDIPGARQDASNTYKKSSDLVKVLTDLVPYLSDVTNKANTSESLNDLAISQQTSEPYAQLMTELYSKYGPQLNTIGNDIAKQNALSEISTNQKLINNGGSDLVKQVNALQQEIDPEYYNTRAQEAQKLTDLFNSIDLTGGLSSTERDEIAKGLARENINRGTYNSPSNLDTVANAMQYGQAGRNRVLENQNALVQAINASTAFLPSSKSGIDAFNIGTGKTATTTNAGNNLFTGIASPSDSNTTNSLLSTASATQQQRAQQSANSKVSGWNKFANITSGLSGLLSGLNEGSSSAKTLGMI